MAIIQPLLREGRVDFEGEFFQARDAVNRPRGPRASGAPILVGSNWPPHVAHHRPLRRRLEHGLAWGSRRGVPQMAAVDEACRDVGRDPATLVRTAGGNIAMPGYLGKRPDPIRGSDEEIAATILRFRELGIQHFVAGLDPCTPETIEQFARVMELVDAT